MEFFAEMDPLQVPYWVARAVGGVPGPFDRAERILAIPTIPRPGAAAAQPGLHPRNPMRITLGPDLAVAGDRLATAAAATLAEASTDAYSALAKLLHHLTLVHEGEARLPPPAGRNPRADAILAHLHSFGAPQGPASEDERRRIYEGLRDGERWEVLAGGVGPGVLVLVAAVAGGGGRGLSWWRCKEVGWGEVAGAVGWVLERRPAVVAWCRTWGAELVRGLMGVFLVQGGVAGGGGGGAGGEEEVRGGREWRRRVLELCNRMPRGAAPVAGVLPVEDD